MKNVIILPKPGTEFKYRIGTILDEIKAEDNNKFTRISALICLASKRDRQTLYRWRMLTHEDKADIPAACLKLISFILTLEGYNFSVDQLTNYVVGLDAPNVVPSAEAAPSERDHYVINSDVGTGTYMPDSLRQYVEGDGGPKAGHS